MDQLQEVTLGNVQEMVDYLDDAPFTRYRERSPMLCFSFKPDILSLSLNTTCNKSNDDPSFLINSSIKVSWYSSLKDYRPDVRQIQVGLVLKDEPLLIFADGLCA